MASPQRVARLVRVEHAVLVHCWELGVPGREQVLEGVPRILVLLEPQGEGEGARSADRQPRDADAGVHLRLQSTPASAALWAPLSPSRELRHPPQPGLCQACDPGRGLCRAGCARRAPAKLGAAPAFGTSRPCSALETPQSCLAQAVQLLSAWSRWVWSGPAPLGTRQPALSACALNDRPRAHPQHGMWTRGRPAGRTEQRIALPNVSSGTQDVAFALLLTAARSGTGQDATSYPVSGKNACGVSTMAALGIRRPVLLAHTPSMVPAAAATPLSAGCSSWSACEGRA